MEPGATGVGKDDKLRTNPDLGGYWAARFCDMEPSAAVAVIEADLRHLARSVLSARHGSNWLADTFSEETLAALEQRRTEEASRRAPVSVPEDLLSYTHLYELRRVVEKHWQDFAEALGKKRDFAVLMDKVEDFRNAPAHSRELLPHERSLLEGIAGTIRTQVTAYRSMQMSDARHYPIIETIRDSFGNEPKTLDPNDGLGTVWTGLRLAVGTIVRFEARGWDAQGRDLSWSLLSYGGRRQDVGTGTEMSAEYVVTEDDVGSHRYIEISLVGAGRYHRHNGFDHKVTFGYVVEPPDGDGAPQARS